MVVAVAYFVYLAGLAIARSNLRTVMLSVAALASILVIGMPYVMPLLYLLAGYWLPGLLVREPDLRFERRLLDADRWLFGPHGLARFEQGAPRVLIEYLEMAYLLCYAVVPAGYVCLLLGSYGPDAIDKFWTVVLLASFACYGVLPWLPTRAPRAIEPARATMRSSIRGLNLAVLNRASVQWNTFPSGHTAASLATALAVGSYMPLAGVILAGVALSIAAGSVVGRYHYAADAVAGAAVAILAFLMASAARGL
jgi:membrane-associated phospholipid phosphatase